MNRIRKGDEVIVIAGKDKGRRGTVREVRADGRVVVEGINLVKKHQKPNPNAGIGGGIVEKEMPLHVSNVMLWNAATGKGDRVGFKFVGEGESRKKVRYFKSNQEMVDA
ncbi:MAG: 50S ribosomal protein L24 [Sinobacteraceae bacterium]|jgi:large subunit ribosomal protein L24|nr:50S ribosomal protein L24 [Nevskia sp.]MDI3261133.1 50S ribosomal protein L24 [Nevskiaceae bacterium]